MNSKLLPVVAAFLILVCVLGITPATYAVTRAVIGPQLVVTTIPEDDQINKKGMIILGLAVPANPLDPVEQWVPAQVCTTDPAQAPYDPVTNPTGATSGGLPFCGPQDLLSQHKLLVTYNGQTLRWRDGDTAGVPLITCNVLEKDKVNFINDPKKNVGKQFPTENLMTKLVDVSDKFVCKPRWKSPAPGTLESAGVLDVYYIGPYDIHWAADNVLVVEASLTIGRTVVFGSDIQDICLLGYAFYGPFGVPIMKPEFWTVDWNANSPFWELANAYLRDTHWVFVNPLGPFSSCEDLALIQRDIAGVELEQAGDPVALEA